MGKLSVLLALGLLAVPGCDRRAEPVDQASATPPKDLPKGAIKVRDNYYMVPVVKDELGCQLYNPWSDRYATPTVLYYRGEDGFVMDRSKALCTRKGG